MSIYNKLHLVECY